MEQMLLVFTVYNCEGLIIKALNDLDESVMRYFKEILIVDADSTDRTKDDVKAYARKHRSLPIRLIASRSRSGEGSAVKTAFEYAIKNNYRYLIVAKGDNQVDIHDYLPVLKSRIYQKYDCILGARFMIGSRLQGYSAARIAGNLIMNIIYSCLCQKRIFDLKAGLNLYSTAMLKSRYYQKYPNNQLFFACMLLAEKKLKHKLIFAPISTIEDGIVFPMKIMNTALFLLKESIVEDV